MFGNRCSLTIRFGPSPVLFPCRFVWSLWGSPWIVPRKPYGISWLGALTISVIFVWWWSWYTAAFLTWSLVEGVAKWRQECGWMYRHPLNRENLFNVIDSMFSNKSLISFYSPKKHRCDWPRTADRVKVKLNVWLVSPDTLEIFGVYLIEFPPAASKYYQQSVMFRVDYLMILSPKTLKLQLNLDLKNNWRAAQSWDGRVGVVERLQGDWRDCFVSVAGLLLFNKCILGRLSSHLCYWGR